MSLHIRWAELVSSTAWLAEVRAHLARVISEAVNQPREGALDDRTRVRLLELSLGEVDDPPPQVELLRLDMEERGRAREGAGPNEALQQQEGATEPGQPPLAISVEAAAPSTPSPPRVPTTTPPLALGALPLTPRSSAAVHASSSSVSGRCSACQGRLRVSSLALPSVSLRGRVAYAGGAYVTVQIRRQVNPLVSKRGLVGRLGRAHHAAAAMHTHLDAELWVRVSGLDIQGTMQVTYTPGEKPLFSSGSSSGGGGGGVARNPSASPSPSPARSRLTTPRTSPSPSPAPPSAHHFRPSSLCMPSPLPSSPAPASFSPGLCSCVQAASASAGLPSAGAVPFAPASVSVLLESNPLNGLVITSCLDGSAAGVKLRTTIEAQLAAALKGVVGRRIDIPMPK